MITEKLLQFIWRYSLLKNSSLFTLEGEPLQIIKPGIWNTNSGPDFLEAKIKINNTIWVGHVELHIYSSDWIKHKHQFDPAYDNVILHVVYHHDTPLALQCPTLVLKSEIDEDYLPRYERLLNNTEKIACNPYLEKIPNLAILQQLDGMFIERMHHKSIKITQQLGKNHTHWKEVFYQQIGLSFGLSINQYPFQLLCDNLPLKLIMHYRNDPLKLEALVFGIAGFLNDYFEEEYPLLLQHEFAYLQQLHQLIPIAKKHWKFLRLRPSNFPSIRLAQFAAFLPRMEDLMSLIFRSEKVAEIYKIFDVELPTFWDTHYTLYEKSKEQKKRIGKQQTQIIIINAIAPFLFAYGKENNKAELEKQAWKLMQQLPFEKNHITQLFQNFPNKNAGDSQALIQLYNTHCSLKFCLACRIGYSLLKNG